MKNNLTILFALAIAWLAAVVTPSVATAQTPELATDLQQNEVRGPGMRPPIDVTLESSYTAAGKVKFRGTEFGNSDAYNVSL